VDKDQAPLTPSAASHHLFDSEQAPNPATTVNWSRKTRFDQDLLVIPVGSTFSFSDLDEIFHHVFALRAEFVRLGNYSRANRHVGVRQTGCGIGELPVCNPDIASAIVSDARIAYVYARPSGKFVLSNGANGQYNWWPPGTRPRFFRQEVEVHRQD